MKAEIVKIITMVLAWVLNRLTPPKPSKPVYTFRRSAETYLVGYWSAHGDFITKAEVPSEDEARELVAELNKSGVGY